VNTMTSWPDNVDEVLDGDHCVMLAYATPARGVVLTPVSNFGVRDRGAGTVTVNSSVGAWKKLDRMRRDAHVALAFHTRDHALNERPEYVLVQGRAALSPPIDDYPSTILENWERIESWHDLSPPMRRWLHVYATRVAIEIAVERIVVWPDLRCRGTPEVHGAPLPPDPPAPQALPKLGTDPRIRVRVARRAAGLPHILLGWVGADRFPMVVPVRVAGDEDRGLVLQTGAGGVPHGGRRAGLTAHWFSRGVIGQHQRVHTGWLEAGADGHRLLYAPHTRAAYRFPPSTLLFRLVAGGVTRWRLREARRAGA